MIVALGARMRHSYKSNYLNLNSNPRLTADAIIESLANDTEYQKTSNKTKYNLNEIFYQKWLYWTEAFEKGIKNSYIQLI